MIINKLLLADSRANEVSMQLEIDYYESQFKAFKRQIDEEELFFYSRFSGAVEEGEKYMQSRI